MHSVFFQGIGLVTTESALPGVVTLFGKRSGPWIELGNYANVDDAIAGLPEVARLSSGSMMGQYLVTSPAPHNKALPVFDSSKHDASIIGIAHNRSDADRLLAPGKAAYCDELTGPNGEEGWVPADEY